MGAGLNTIKTFLMVGDSSTPPVYSVLVPIKDFPDLGGDIEEIEVTDLSDTRRRYIAGIKTNDKLEFTCNYTWTNFNTLNSLSGTQKLQVAFGFVSGTPNKYGTDGYVQFEGEVSVRISGKGVNEAREMVVSVVVSSDLTFGQTALS